MKGDYGANVLYFVLQSLHILPSQFLAFYDNYEAIFYAVEKKNSVQNFFQCFITPVLISNEIVEILFFPILLSNHSPI